MIVKVYPPQKKNNSRWTIFLLNIESQLNTPLALVQFAGWNAFVGECLCTYDFNFMLNSFS